MTPIKRNLLYIFRGTLLRLRITWNHGTALTLSVGYHVNKTDSRGRASWDGSRCRKNTTHGDNKIPASIINKELDILEDRVAKAFYFFENIDVVPTKDQLKEKLNPESTADNKTISTMIDEFIAEQSVLNQWTFAMTKNVKLSLMSMVDALGADMKLDEVDESKYAKLLRFFYNKTTVKKNSEGIPEVLKGLKNTTINSYLNNIRRFTKWAEQKKYCVECRILTQATSLKTIKKPVVFLEWHELNRLMSLDLSYLDTLEPKRDMFIFCCFTGLRFSDMMSLKWSEVFDNRIEIVTQKTSDRLSIELNKFSKQIIEKYKQRQHEPSDHVFPQLSLNHYNNTLNKLAQMAGIDEEIEIVQLSGSEKQIIKLKKYECISSHSARRTFVCNSLSLGIPPNVVMQWTGHKNYKSMNPYIDITSKAKQENMGLFNNLPFPNQRKTSK